MPKYVSTLGLIFLLAGMVSAEEAMPVGQINVSGNRRIETATVLNAVKTQPGEPFSPDKIQQDVKAIYATGFFDEVTVDAAGVEGKLQITFIVKEKPTIKEIVIQGNEEIKEDKIREKLDIKPLNVLDTAAVSRNLKIIEDLYKDEGFYLVEIKVEDERLSDDWARVIYKIKEGPEVQIDHIYFTGNNNFTEGELRDAMDTKEHWFLSWLTGSGKLKTEMLNQDLDKILAFYYDHGFLDAQAGNPNIEFSADKSKLTITIPVTEGEKYTVTDISLSGNRILTNEELMAGLKMKVGDIFSRQTLRDDIQWVTEQYAQTGYLLTEVYPSTDKDSVVHTVKITINVQEGKKSYVGRIIISGNKSTRDKVIRRELRFSEGDVLTSKDLKRSYERLTNLAFFETIDIKNPPGEKEDTLDVDVTVKERLTGAVSLGAGWSSVNKLVGNVSISEGNLFGRGQKLVLSGTFGKLTQNYALSFTEPHLYDTNFSGGSDIFYRTDSRTSFRLYNISRKGGDLSTGYPLTEYISAGLTYTYEIINIYDVQDDAPHVIKSQAGQSTTSAVTLSLSRDSRDNRIRPTTGSYHRISTEYAGDPLGGTNNYIKDIGETSWHFPLFWKFVLSLHGAIGYITGHNGHSIPIPELFALGGDTTVRGYENGSIGPKVDNEVVGGNQELYGNAELHFPIVEPLAGLIFYDTGGVWEKPDKYTLREMRSGVGAGIRFYTPIGPIRLDWGYKLGRKPGETKYQWHFAIGTYF